MRSATISNVLYGTGVSNSCVPSLYVHAGLNRIHGLPCSLGKGESLNLPLAFVPCCFPQRAFPEIFPYGCSGPCQEISPSPMDAQETCLYAALSFLLDSDGVCLALEGGLDLLEVQDLRLPAWLCARCMSGDLSCLGCCHSKTMDADS